MDKLRWITIALWLFSYRAEASEVEAELKRVKRWKGSADMNGGGGEMFRGTAGVDYPNYKTIPTTNFRCSDHEYEGGHYADVETQCQVYHVCHGGRKDSFLCGPGTTFNQQILACDYWYSTECDTAPSFYYVNAEIGKTDSTWVSKEGDSQSNPQGNNQGKNGQYNPATTNERAGGQYNPATTNERAGGQYNSGKNNNQDNPGLDNGGKENPEKENSVQDNPETSNNDQYNTGTGNDGQYNPGPFDDGQYNPGTGDDGQYNPPGDDGQYNPPGDDGQYYSETDNDGKHNPGTGNDDQQNHDTRNDGQENHETVDEGQANPETSNDDQYNPSTGDDGQQNDEIGNDQANPNRVNEGNDGNLNGNDEKPCCCLKSSNQSPWNFPLFLVVQNKK